MKRLVEVTRQMARVTVSIRRPHDVQRYRFVDALGQGWYHNVDLDGVRAWSLFGARTNSPLADPLGHDALWKEFCAIWQSRAGTSTAKCLSALHVLDVGSAEGFFSFAAVSAGARHVNAINPPGQLTERFKRLVDIRQLHDQITIDEGLFPQTGEELVRQVDLILALGVIYHAQNCEAFVDALTIDRKPLWVEVMTSLEPSNSFDPVTHQDSRHQLFSHAWLEAVLEDRGYELIQCSTYNSRCLEDGYLTPNAEGLWTRRAFVAFPDGGNTF